MKFLIFTALTCFISLSACAQPKLPPESDTLAGTGQELRLDRCAASFASGHCVAMAWEKMPTEEDFGTFLFKTYRPDSTNGSLTEVDLDGNLSVILWMPSMGHGSSPVTLERLSVGTYRASNVYFSMKGKWEIRFQLKVGNEKKDQAIVPISI